MPVSHTWLITGAGRGVGKTLAEAALAAGHRVAATIRDHHSLPEHRNLSIHHLDVRDRQSCRDVMQEAVDTHGRIDVLINNAGYGLVGAIEEVDEAEARAILDTDLLGPLWLTQAALPIMRRQRSGHIVQISTVGAVGAMPFLGLYNAAKWGLEGFSEALAGEAGEFGIRVTLAELGAVDTEWATGGMQFSAPLPEYDGLRRVSLGTAEVPWPVEPGTTGGGTSPTAIAQVLLDHITNPTGNVPLRILVGDDAPAQVATVLQARLNEYRRDPRFAAAPTPAAPAAAAATRP